VVGKRRIGRFQHPSRVNPVTQADYAPCSERLPWGTFAENLRKIDG